MIILKSVKLFIVLQSIKIKKPIRLFLYFYFIKTNFVCVTQILNQMIKYCYTNYINLLSNISRL